MTKYFERDMAEVRTRDFAGHYAPDRIGASRSLTPEGFLLCRDVPIARTGVQVYHERDFARDSNVKGDAQGFIRVQRIPDEVFRPETLASFEGKPITIGHPDEFVTPQTHQQLSVGTAQNVRRGKGDDSHLVIADLLITAADAIQYVNRELPEVSCGYNARYDQKSPGEAVQRRILGNHVALVPRGRAGSNIAVRDGASLPFRNQGGRLVAPGTLSASILEFRAGRTTDNRPRGKVQRSNEERRRMLAAQRRQVEGDWPWPPDAA